MTHPNNKYDILNEYLFYNNNILMNNKMLQPVYLGPHCNQHIKLFYILSENGSIKPKL